MSFGAVAAIGGAVIAADAAGNAADKQAGAANAATAVQRQATQRQMDAQAPFQESGVLANNRLLELMGLDRGYDTNVYDEIYRNLRNESSAGHAAKYGFGFDGAPAWAQGGIADHEQALKNEAIRQAKAQYVPGERSGEFGSLFKKFSMDDFQADPGYQFRQTEGQKGVERSAASRGGLFSGAAAKSLERFNQGLASQEYGNAYNRYTNDQNNQYNKLAGLVNSGQGAANQIGNAQLNFGNQQANNMIGAGNAQAAAGIAQANALSGGINDAFNYYNQTNALNKALQSGNAYGNIGNQYFSGYGGMGD